MRWASLGGRGSTTGCTDSDPGEDLAPAAASWGSHSVMLGFEGTDSPKKFADDLAVRSAYIQHKRRPPAVPMARSDRKASSGMSSEREDFDLQVVYISASRFTVP